MEIIPVTPDLSIEMDSSEWRLVQDYDEGKALRTLVQANPQSLKFHAAFVEARPVLAPEVPPTQVSRVVVGWTPEKQSWQLGLLLNGSSLTWCELVAWPSASPAQHEQTARAAGQALSMLIQSPFQVVEAPTVSSNGTGDYEMTRPSYSTNPISVEPISVLPLPLNFREWVARAAPQGMLWEQNSRWRMNHVVRALFFVLACFAFIFLGIGSLSSGLASVSPQWLPLAAFVIAAILLLSALQNLWNLFTRRRIILDETNREVRSQRSLTGLVDWRVAFDDIEYLLVSQETAHPQGRRSKKDPMVISQDTWVHIFARQNFYQLVELEKVEGCSWEWELVRRRVPSEERHDLNLREYDTPLHHAVKQLADRLGAQVYIDIR
jgi:hypothetical protein